MILTDLNYRYAGVCIKKRGSTEYLSGAASKYNGKKALKKIINEKK